MAEDLGAIKYSIIADTSDLSKAEAEMDAFGDTAKRSAKDVDKLGTETAEAGKKGKKGAEELNKGMTSAAGAIKLAAGALAALGASIGIREIVAYSDAWQSASNQLRLITSGTKELEQAQSNLMGVANQTRSSFESTANLYARLTRATSEMGLSQSELLGITKTINQSFAVSGATASEAAAAITQLSQGLAAGALRGDEFNSVAEQAPGIMRAIAESLDKTVGELRAFAAEGGITADIVVTALQGAAQSIDRDFSKSVQTFGQSMQVARNNMLAFIGSSETVEDVTGSAARAVVFLSENLDTLVTVGGALASVMAVRVASSLLTAGAAAVTAAAGVVTLGGAMALLGGPVGIGIIASYGVYKLVDAYIDHNREARNVETAAFLVKNGIKLTGEEFAGIVAKIDSASQSLRGYVQAGGALSTIAQQMQAELDAKRRALLETDTATVTFTADTLKLIDQLENERKALGMTTREQAMFNAELKALANGDGPEAIATVRRLAAENYDLSASQVLAEKTLEDWNAENIEFFKAQKKAREEQEKNQASIAETIVALENEQVALGMTARGQAIFNAVTEEFNRGAAPEQIARIAQLTAENYDLAESQRVTGKAAEDAAKQAADNWQRTHEALSDAFVDIMNNGGNAFDNIAKSFSAMIQRMVAEWAASKLMNLMGMGGGGGGGIASILGSLGGGGSGGGGGLGGVAGTIGKIFSGGGASMPGGVGGTVGMGAKISSIAGSVGSAVSGAGSAIMSGLAAIPGWGWALGGAALAAKLLDSGGTMSGNAGMLIRDTPGADGRTFDVPAFASGFDPVGFARREDQGAATQVIDVFRADDAVLTALAKASGIDVSYSANNFGGYDEKGRGNGLFFGQANEDGDNTAVPLDQQRTQFVSQWLRGLGGQVDQSLINDALGAGNADAMIARAAQLAGIDGSHAGGLNRVPFDGYIAELHKDEEVLRAGDPRNQNNGGMMDGAKMELIKTARLMYTILQRWDFDGLPRERV